MDVTILPHGDGPVAVDLEMFRLSVDVKDIVVYGYFNNTGTNLMAYGRYVIVNPGQMKTLYLTTDYMGGFKTDYWPEKTEQTWKMRAASERKVDLIYSSPEIRTCDYLWIMREEDRSQYIDQLSSSLLAELPEGRCYRPN